MHGRQQHNHDSEQGQRRDGHKNTGYVDHDLGHSGAIRYCESDRDTDQHRKRNTDDDDLQVLQEFGNDRGAEIFQIR